MIPKQPNVTSLNFYYLQKNAMEDSIEIVIEKLLHVSKDVVPKVIFSLTECYLYLKNFVIVFLCMCISWNIFCT